MIDRFDFGSSKILFPSIGRAMNSSSKSVRIFGAGETVMKRAWQSEAR